MEGKFISRRTVLTMGGSLAFAAGLKGRVAAQGGAADRRVIDVHHHYFAPTFLAKRREQITESGGEKMFSWTPQVSLEQMDAAGCTTAIISSGGPGIWYGKDTLENNRAMARAMNEFGARMGSDHPGRYGLFASLPLPDTDGSLKEIDYAFATLKADGAGLWSNFDGRFLGDAGYAPVFEELNRRKAVVYVHPKVTSDFDDAADPLRALGINWTNTTRTIISMLDSGTFTRFPDIKFIFSHGGGLTWMLAPRLTAGAPEKLAALKRLYFDTAQVSGNPAAWDVFKGFADPSHILFGSDCPYGNVGAMLKDLRSRNLTASEAAAIEHSNADPLFPRFRP
jgi:6-methylsalicylate decarboxylase